MLFDVKSDLLMEAVEVRRLCTDTLKALDYYHTWLTWLEDMDVVVMDAGVDDFLALWHDGRLAQFKSEVDMLARRRA